ncbi:unnamed protein product [Oikopleura dioica]|uniref:Uncharacterized protein n=1 Tax=Oikopleura dioica TaxID=34765 RepID=E4X896_OIKDI|nr:unnamed protein product [Oikopleura dioica]
MSISGVGRLPWGGSALRFLDWLPLAELTLRYTKRAPFSSLVQSIARSFELFQHRAIASQKKSLKQRKLLKN